MRLALLCVLATMAASQCPNSSTSSTGTSSASSGSGSSNKTCKKVTTINRPLSKLFKDQPLFDFIVSKNPRFARVDNICLTFFALPEDPEKFKVYEASVYIDGSTSITSFIAKSYAVGENVWASPFRGFSNFNLGYIGCGAYARYSCPHYGNAAAPFVLSFGPGIGPVGNGTGKISEECVENAKRLAKENGLDLSDYYLPPFNLPTNCVYQQICLPEDSPLSFQQGNTCKKYTTSSNQTS